MIIYRLAVDAFKNDLSGNGAKLFGGRWNSTGISALYTAQHISLAILEILVNMNKNFIPINYHLIKIEIPNDIKGFIVSKEKLKKNWKEDFEYTQFIGSEFFKQNKALYLQVPSAIVDEEFNFVFNPLHPDYKKIKIKAVSKFKFDNRLFILNE